MNESRFFIASDGSMYRDNCFEEPFRKDFQVTHNLITDTAQFKATLRNGAYAWPGGYPLYFITADGEALCFKCAKENAKQIMSNQFDNWHYDWRVIGCEVNWEDNDLQCCHCNSKIESAYGSDEEE